jgi:hypothetical protein
LVELEDVEDFLVEAAREEEFEDGFNSPNSIYERSILFEKSENYDNEGTRYELDAARTDEELVSLLGEDFTVEIDSYPCIRQFGYSMEDDRFTLKSENDKEEYKFAAEDSGFYSAIGTPFNDRVWELYLDQGDNLNGVNRSDNNACDLNDSNIGRKMDLMIETMNQIEQKLYEDGKNILFTSNYRNDVERLPRGRALSSESKKIRDADTNLNLNSVTPTMAMTKRMSDALNPLIQFKHKRASLRGLFVDGFRFDGAENDKLYGVTLLDKDNSEQEKLSREIRDSSNNFFQDAESYARHILESDDIV